MTGRNRTKADVHRVRDGDVTVALKDYGGRPWWIRASVGRFLIRRESAAWRLVDGTPGLPRFLGRIGPYALATRWIDARPLAEVRADAVPPGTFDALERLLDRLHARGLAVGDLHHRDVLLDADGGVWLVDLALSWRRGGWRTGLWRRACELDRLAVMRMRARAAGDDPDACAARDGGRAGVWHARGRRLRRRLDRLRGRRSARRR